MQLELFEKAICCAYCGKPKYDPFYVERHTNRGTVRLAFCGEHHANEYYMEKLREAGT